MRRIAAAIAPSSRRIYAELHDRPIAPRTTSRARRRHSASGGGGRRDASAGLDHAPTLNLVPAELIDNHVKGHSGDRSRACQN
jgi:hypothetical protein